MPQTFKGELVVKPEHRFALVVAEFNEFITTRLVDSTIECFVRHGGKESQVTLVWVPGCFEIPTAAMGLAKSGKYSAVVCLGAVIRGQTDHYDYVAEGVARGVAAIGPATGVPAIFGVITADTLEQAVDRAGLKHGNAGWNAACTAMTMANVMGKVSGGMIHERTQARRIALQCLYQVDVQGADLFMTNGVVEFINETTPDPKIRELAYFMAKSAWAFHETADQWLTRLAEKWTIARMATVDRNILRLAAWELVNYPQTPPKVVLDEAITIAKEFSTADSSAFINGLLDALLKEHLAQTGKTLE